MQAGVPLGPNIYVEPLRSDVGRYADHRGAFAMSVPGIDSFAFTDAGTDGTYGIGDAVEVTVTFSEAVTVTGTPQLEIDITGFPYPLNYSSGSGSTALVFSGLTVTSGLSAIYGIGIKANKLELNGGTIKASAGGSPDAVLDHAAVPLSSNRKIDGREAGADHHRRQRAQALERRHEGDPHLQR